jgi:hypothetical protein
MKTAKEWIDELATEVSTKGISSGLSGWIRAIQDDAQERPPAKPSFGFWRSARGDNHGHNSEPGDVWVYPGDITDTDRMDWLIKQGPPGACSGIGLNEMAWGCAYAYPPEEDSKMLRQAIDAAMFPNTELRHGEENL